MAEVEARSKWSGRWAFVLAGAASAVGLGNMWRFPYLAAKFGGGTFLIVYVILVFTVGVSMLLLETAFGRYADSSVVGAFAKLGKKYTPVGILVALVPFIITPYYCIIGGWVTKYMASYITENPSTMADGGGFFVNFMTSTTESYLWMLIFMAIVFIIVALGVKGGIEKANMVLMPALIILVIGVAGYTLAQPGAIDGLMYYLTPDFSKFSTDLLVNALGQMFYSLSLAMGIMITYGSYLSKHESLTTSAGQIVGFDFGVSLLAGLLIVPAAFVAMGSGEAVAAKAGPTLMFITLPNVFDGMGSAANIIGMLFFMLVLFAALTSAISLTETCVSIFQDSLRLTRRRALCAVFIIVVILGFMINLGYNGWSFIEPMGEGSTILDFADFISNSVLMPITALLTCVIIGWVVKPKFLVDEIASSSKFRMRKFWAFVIKYLAPIICLVVLGSQVLPLIIG